jgi:hypothetical protein
MEETNGTAINHYEECRKCREIKLRNQMIWLTTKGFWLCKNCYDNYQLNGYLVNPADPADPYGHHAVAEEIAQLLDRKRADYGSENIKKFGSQGVLVRVSDKVERLINLTGDKERKINFEGLEENWADIAGYSILALLELREGR